MWRNLLLGGGGQDLDSDDNSSDVNLQSNKQQEPLLRQENKEEKVDDNTPSPLQKETDILNTSPEPQIEEEEEEEENVYQEEDTSKIIESTVVDDRKKLEVTAPRSPPRSFFKNFILGGDDDKSEGKSEDENKSDNKDEIVDDDAFVTDEEDEGMVQDEQEEIQHADAAKAEEIVDVVEEEDKQLEDKQETSPSIQLQQSTDTSDDAMDTHEAEKNSSQQKSSTGSPFSSPRLMIGNQFRYVGSLANRFMETVTANDDDDDEEEEEDDEGNASEENGWNDEDEDLMWNDQEEPDTPRTTNTNERRTTSTTTTASPPHGETPTLPVLREPSEQKQGAVGKVFAPPTFPSPESQEDGWDDDDDDAMMDFSNSEPQVVGQLDSVMQEIKELEQQSANKDNNKDKEDDDGLRSEERQQSAVVKEIQQEIEELNASQGGIVPAVVVDQTPNDRASTDGNGNNENNDDPSLIPQAGIEDLTRDTGDAASRDEEVYDDENEDEYGPVVDHTPSKPIIMRRQDSLAVQAGDQPDNMSAVNDDDEETLSKEDDIIQQQQPKELFDTPAVVDHTPTDAKDYLKPGVSLSVGVLASVGDTADVEQDDDKTLDENHAFGPVVDHTPQTPFAGNNTAAVSGTNSMAVHASEIEEDFEQDEAMDYTCFGDSTAGGFTDTEAADEGSETDGWDDDEGALVSADDEALGGGGGGADNDDEDKKLPAVEPKRTTFSPNLTTFEHHVVDQLPAEISENITNKNPSVMALAMSEDLSRDTGTGLDEEIYDDENEDAYGLVVDQTPRTPDPSTLSSGANSLAVHASALKEDIENDDAMDDTSYNGSSVLQQEEEESSLVKNSAMDDEGEQEQPLGLGKVGVALVDHTPSEMDSPLKQNRGDPSVEVLASDANTADTTEDKNVVYGPVVDHTPTTPAQSSLTRSDSVVVQGNDDIESVDDTSAAGDVPEDTSGIEDDTFNEEIQMQPRDSDENQLVDHIPPRPDSRYGDGSTQVAADPSEVLSEVDDLAPEEQNFGPVVDLTPSYRPAALPPDQPPGDRSTIVFAPPSVAADDLDPEDDHDGVVEQENWDNNEPSIGEAPNPQSGNDEPVRNRLNEQLVDFLPPANESNDEEAGDTTRAAMSEMTIGGAQSLIPGGEPREDDFGPVVDQIPETAQASLRSHASTSTQLTPSECRALEKDDRVNCRSDDASSQQTGSNNIVVDHLPHLERKRAADSTATLGRSQLSEEEEEEDASKFGPVVDHLPTSRASLAPSRGGSTVDALATVSEVDSDDEEGDGWDDDGDLDTSLGGASEPVPVQRRIAQPPSEGDRGVTVRFETSIESTKQHGSTDASDSHYYDTDEAHQSRGTDGTSISDSSAQFYEAHQTLIDKSFAEADTPPSTPYRRPDSPMSTERDLKKSQISVPFLHAALDSHELKCETCDNARAIDCPCVKKLLIDSNEGKALVGSMKTSDGNSITIDFSKMMDEEIERRRSIERELEELKARVQSDELDQSLRAAKEQELETEISDLRQIRDSLSKEVSEYQNESTKLREEKDKLDVELLKAKESVKGLENSQSSLVAKEASYESEIQALKQALSGSEERNKKNSNFETHLETVQKDLAKKTMECKDLESRVGLLEQRLKDAESLNTNHIKESDEVSDILKQNIDTLKKQLASSEELVQSTEAARKELEKKLKVIDSEVQNLRISSKQVAEVQTQHEHDLQEQYNLLDKKTSDIKALEEKVSALQEEKSRLMIEISEQRNLAEQSETLANELLAVAKERDLLEQALSESREAMISLKKTIEENGAERAALDSKRKEEHLALEKELKEVRKLLENKEKEFSDLESQVNSIEEDRENMRFELAKSQEAHDSAIMALEANKSEITRDRELIAEREEEIVALKAKLNEFSTEHDRLEQEMKVLSTNLTEVGEALQYVEGQSEEYSTRNSELEEEVRNLKERIDSLQRDQSSIITERDEATQHIKQSEEKYAKTIADYEAKVLQLTQEYEEDVTALKSGSEKLLKDIANLEKRESQHAQSVEEVERHAQAEAQKYEENMTRLTTECEQLREEVARLEELATQHSLESQDMQRDDSNLLAEKEELQSRIEKFEQEILVYKDMQKQANIAIDLLEKQLEEQSNQHDEEISKFDEEKRQLRAELEKEKGRKDDVTGAVDGLEIREQAIRREYEVEMAHLKEECNMLRAQAKRHEEVAEELASERDRLGEVMRECDILSEENEEMLVQFGLLKQQMDDSEEHNKNLQAELDKIKSAGLSDDSMVNELRTINDDLTTKMDQLTQDKDMLLARVKELTKNVEDAKKENNALNAVITGLDAHTADLSNRHKEAENEIQKLKQQIQSADANTLKKRLASLVSECQQKDDLISKNSKQIDELKKEIERVQDNSDSKNRKLETIRKRAKEQGEEHSQRIKELEDHSKELESKLELSQNQTKAAEAALEAKRHVVTVLKESELQIQELEVQLKEKDKTVAALQDNVDELREQLSKVSDGANAQNEQELVALKKQIDTLNDALDSTRNRLAARESDVDRMATEMRNLQSEKNQKIIEEVAREMKELTLKSKADVMRSRNMVSKASLLKRSDSARADAILRLEAECRASSETLRQLRESIQKYVLRTIT